MALATADIHTAVAELGGGREQDLAPASANATITNTLRHDIHIRLPTVVSNRRICIVREE